MNIKYLGIDWGEKNIGLAIADSDTGIAMPHKTVSSINEVTEIITSEEIDVVVIGKHSQMSRAQFSTSSSFHRFVNDLMASTDKPIEFSDETMSSLAADKLAGDSKTKAGRDEIAAMLILQSFLDKKNIK